MNKLLSIVGGSTLVFIVLALMMAVIPGFELSKTPPGAGVKSLTPLQAEGRDVYAANGCGYCHTQQVRPIGEDNVFGRPSAPGDFAYQTPELAGSERTGPDLADVGSRRGSDVWQYMHLYNPRSVVPESIMPSFAWMFRVTDKPPSGVSPVPLPPAYAPKHGTVVPTHEAEALVAYLLSLKQTVIAAEGVGPNAGANAATAAMGGMPKPTAPTGASSATGAGPVPSAAQIAHGQTLFLSNCSACHQASGQGLPGVFPALAGDAVVNKADPTRHIHTVLFGLHGMTVSGVPYASQMPPFGAQLRDQDVADLIDYERSAWGNHGRPVTPAEVTAIRAHGQ